jgi:hypothetical protein
VSSLSDDSNNERFQQKKAKTEASMSVSASSARDRRKTVGWKVDANGDKFWELSKMRRVTISSFRGKILVNIREYYEKDGQELPGKKVKCDYQQGAVPAQLTCTTGHFFANRPVLCSCDIITRN